MIRKVIIFALFAFCALLPISPARAQQGYEFEVYSTDIGVKGATEIELNSNFVAKGRAETDEGFAATHHALRSSLEISRTLSSWIQATAYVTANARPGHALSYVGNRAKITAVAPASWKLPFGLGVANELSYARAPFAEYTWAYELTPIIAIKAGQVSVIFNPAFERGLSGSGEHHIEVEPRAKIGYGFGDDAAIALEYYGGLGGIGENYTLRQQRHHLFGKFESEVSSRLELGVGVGRGLTRSSDGWVITTALEYRLGR